MDQSFTSNFSVTSTAATGGQANPTCTLAYIYDIPKDDGYSSRELTQMLRDLGYKCEVQLNKHGNKPFYNAMVKFDSIAHLQLALTNHRSFELRGGKHARILPFDVNLKRNVKSSQVMNQKLYDPNDFNYKVLIQPEVSTLKQQQLQKETEEQKLQVMPDNSTAVVNLFLKGLDKSWTVKDLH